MELGCHEDDALIFLAVGTGPFLGLEVAGDGDVFAFFEAVEGGEAFVLAPCLDVDVKLLLLLLFFITSAFVAATISSTLNITI